VTGPTRWQHRFRGCEYHHKRINVDTFLDPGREVIDFPFHAIADINRAGFDYQGDYLERSWAQTTFGYQFEDENAFVGDLTFPPLTHGLLPKSGGFWPADTHAGKIFGRDRSALRPQHHLRKHRDSTSWRGVAVVASGNIFSGTRLRFSYATGIKAPRFEEAFARGQGIIPNPDLKAEENRAFQAGIQQSLYAGKHSFSASYYNNLFRNQIDFAILDFNTFTGEYENINKSMAHGAEVELQGRPLSRLSFDLATTTHRRKSLNNPLTSIRFTCPVSLCSAVLNTREVSY